MRSLASGAIQTGRLQRASKHSQEVRFLGKTDLLVSGRLHDTVSCSMRGCRDERIPKLSPLDISVSEHHDPLRTLYTYSSILRKEV